MSILGSLLQQVVLEAIRERYCIVKDLLLLFDNLTQLLFLSLLEVVNAVGIIFSIDYLHLRLLDHLDLLFGSALFHSGTL